MEEQMSKTSLDGEEARSHERIDFDPGWSEERSGFATASRPVLRAAARHDRCSVWRPSHVSDPHGTRHEEEVTRLRAGEEAGRHGWRSACDEMRSATKSAV